MRIALLLVGAGFTAACARAGVEAASDAQDVTTVDAPPNARMVTGGEGADRVLLESGAAVPDSVARLARELGSVRASERVELVFIPANRTFADALLLTDSAIVRHTPKGTIRHSLEESDVNFQPLKREGKGGFLIVTPRGAAPDTLYRDLSSREVFRLLNEVTTWRRARCRPPRV